MGNKDKAQKSLRQTQTADAVASLAGGVLHDLNNILYVLLGNAELGLKKATPEDPARKHLNEIIKAARRGTEIGNRIQIFRQALTASEMDADLSEVLEESRLLLGALLPATVEVAVQGDVSGIRVEMQPADFHQILLNLCQNASRALHDRGSISVKVDRAAQGSGDAPSSQLRVQVIDRGCGIEAEDIPRVFSVDFTTKPVGGAAGFGLAVVRGIVTEVGGSLSIESEVGVGTTVEIFLPCAEIEDVPA